MVLVSAADERPQGKKFESREFVLLFVWFSIFFSFLSFHPLPIEFNVKFLSNQKFISYILFFFFFKESESIEEIPEKRDEEEKQRALASPEIADMKSPDQSSSTGRIVPEEKGICDSREAEKDVEVME